MKTTDERVARYDGTGRDRLAIGAWRVMIRELVEYRELNLRLVRRAIAGQFRQSLMGYLWIILPPVATTVVFNMLQEARIVNVTMAEGALPYALFALLGATLWGFFTQVASGATSSISSAGPLVSKIYFPREILVFSSCGSAFLNLGIRLLVFLLTCFLMGFHPPLQSAGALLLLIPLTALGLGLALFLAPLNAIMNDVGRALEFAFQFGMLMAPTVYPTPDPEAALSGWQMALYWLHVLNPVSHYLYAFHGLLQTGTFAMTTGLAVSIILSGLVFLSGWRFFHACEPLLAERL